MLSAPARAALKQFPIATRAIGAHKGKCSYVSQRLIDALAGLRRSDFGRRAFEARTHIIARLQTAPIGGKRLDDVSPETARRD